MKTVTITCDNCGVEFQVVEAALNSKSIKGHYCQEECLLERTDKLNLLAASTPHASES